MSCSLFQIYLSLDSGIYAEYNQFIYQLCQCHKHRTLIVGTKLNAVMYYYYVSFLLPHTHKFRLVHVRM